MAWTVILTSFFWGLMSLVLCLSAILKACNPINKHNIIWIVVLVIHTSILLQAVNFFGLCKNNTLMHLASSSEVQVFVVVSILTHLLFVSLNWVRQWCINSTHRLKSATCMMYLGLLKNGCYCTDVRYTFTHTDRGKCKCATGKKQKFWATLNISQQTHDYIFQNKHGIELWN